MQKTGEHADCLQDDIAQATADKIINVQQKIKNKNYSPTLQEREQLIALLNESWDKANGDEQSPEDFDSKENA